MPDQNDTNVTQPTITSSTSDNPAAAATPVAPTEPVATPATLAEPTEPAEPEAPTPIIPDEAMTQPDTPAQSVDVAEAGPEPAVDNSGILADVATKINDAHNILIALSSDPSVDEMCAAIGLTLFLDRFGKRVTAIYSGNTPNALEFLKPEETFEQDADILQDFVIALNKEKADHLRYKLDGDYVKIFITPYRSRISNEDLEFSYGDFNVDLVLALDVANGVDLDAALREHGRIMHDAVVINITTGNPGKLGEIEWSDKTSSSVSEMIAELLYKIGGKEKIEKEEATAFLTGIVAATNRFASASTTPKTMEISSRLMDSGANQQLISKNITPDIDNELFGLTSLSKGKTTQDDPTKLDIEHGNEENVDETKEVDTVVTEKESTLLEDLKAAEASLANAAAEVTPEATNEPLRINDEPDLSASSTAPTIEPTPISEPLPEPTVSEAAETPAPVAPPTESTANNDFTSDIKPEKVITPPEDFATETLGEGTNKYGQMLEDALAESNNQDAGFANPAMSSAPAVATEPEINGVPEINYMPMPGDEVLPPPPAPPVDFGAAAMPGSTTMTPEEPATLPPVSDAIATPEATPAPLGPQPAMQDQVYAPQVSNPDAFRIPGIQ
ncbi:hypothetical protein IJJ36_02465 [Candidatus Saccharibacteria bacterium]|nr:hypothetical protein [Candidatus Saccharibacteria bacterium]